MNVYVKMQRHFHRRSSPMATIRALANNRLIRKSVNPMNAYPSFHLSDSCFSQCAKNPPFVFPFNFIRIIGSKPYKTDLSPDTRKVVDGLISIFTQNRFEVDNHDLSQLGSKVTPEIVETVLKSIRSWKMAYRFFIWAKGQSGYFHNCYTYNTMASILSGVRQNAPLRTLVLDVVDSRCCMTPGALGFLIRCLGCVGLVEEANVLFDQVKELGLCVPNNYSYNCLLETISKSSLSDQAEMRLDEMRSFGWMIDKYTLTPLLRVYCNAGKFEKALSVFNQMFEMGWVDAHVLSILVLSLSKWGEVDKAFQLIERMEDCNLRLNEKTFYVLIHGFVSSSRVDKALQLFDKMHRSGFPPDIAVYDVLIGGLSKSEDAEKALHLYSKMKNHGISPDVGIFTKLISSSREEKVMAQLLEEAGEVLSNESLKLLCNSVLNGLIDSGSTDRAYNLVKMMIEDETQYDNRIEKFFKLKGIVCLDSTSFSIIIDALCHTGKLDEALQLFRGMDKIGCKKDVLLYNNLIDALSSAGRVVDGLDLLRDMKHSGFQPTHFTYNSIYGYYCRKGDVIGATSIVKEMCLYRHEPWIKHSTTLVKQLCKHGRAVEASNFLSEMVKEGLVPHLIPYSAAIDGLFKLQEEDHALDLFHNLCSRGYRPDVVACNILINGLCKANRMSEAQELLNTMLAGGLVPSSVTYNSLIDGWCKSCNMDQALVCFSKMAQDYTEPNIITYTTLIDGLCNAGRPDDAVMLWNQMDEKMCPPNRIAFMAIICGLCKNSRPDMAVYYLHEMGKRELRADSYVYVALLDSLLLNNNPALALDILKEIVDKDMFPEPEDKNHALLKDAIVKLSDDPLTSSNVNAILAERCIPSLSGCRE